MPTPFTLPEITKIYTPKVLAVRAFQTPNDMAIPSRNRPGVLDQWRAGDYAVTVFKDDMPPLMMMMQREDFESLFQEQAHV